MDQPPDLVCVGRVVQEMIHFPNNVQGPVLGSPSAYCAVAAAQQGTATGVVTKIGPDMPLDLLEPFAQAGVNTAGMQVGDRTTTSELIYDEQGNKEIRYPSISEPISAGDIPQVYQGCGLIYVCPMNIDVILEDLADVVDVGTRSCVDLGGYGGAHMSIRNRQLIPSLPKFACRVSAHFNLVKASDEDTAIIFGVDDPAESAKKLLVGEVEVVVITMGSDGACVYTAEDSWHVPAVPANAVDSTGCGDAFMAGFLSEYLRSENPLRAARWGSATAACVIEQGGGVHKERMPSSDQIQARFQLSYE